MMTCNQNDDLEPIEELTEAVSQSKAWPFEEARKIIKRYENRGYPEYILFETGYGPSGLPHIGTFGEVARTTMVRHAFHVLTDHKVKTKLLCFSDDMDGLRKVPDNVPDRKEMERYLGRPLSQVPDPFGEGYPSFGAANNARLRTFLDRFGFNYEFASATDYYNAGHFDEVLLKILACYDELMGIILPTLGEERRATYSLFLPISPVSGKILQVPMIARNIKKGTVTYIEPETGEAVETEITGGRVKCQWKVDWAMRWNALGVDYEMAGKDLIASINLSSKICKILGSNPPEGFNYELFLDDKGQKISKSRGNGLTIEEWLTYAPTESLEFYMFLKPKTAKRLYFDIIPKTVDEYYAHLSAYGRQTWRERLSNPVWHIHNGLPPRVDLPISFSMMLNLVSASNAENKEILWGFIARYVKDINAETHTILDQLVEFAIKYFDLFVKPNKKFRIPDESERLTLTRIDEKLAHLSGDIDGDSIQNALLDIARVVERYQDHSKKGPRGGPGVSNAFFQMLYEVLLGQERGPRFGSFIVLYGINEMRALIAEALARPMVK